jgi:hypothetical protein
MYRLASSGAADLEQLTWDALKLDAIGSFTCFI